jgi:cytochrome c oxidase assembly protein subunit 11
MTAKRKHSRLVAKLTVVVLAMFGFGFALVPIYRVICDITGFGGKLSDQPAAVAAGDAEVDRDRLVTVEFVAVVNGNAGWKFRPAVAKMQVHPGELYTTSYRAENVLDRQLVGQASYNVAPGKAARHFAKPDCFCYTRQVFEAGERRDMNVTFFIDPKLPKDVQTVTLSYTFFDVGQQAN